MNVCVLFGRNHRIFLLLECFISFGDYLICRQME